MIATVIYNKPGQTLPEFYRLIERRRLIRKWAPVVFGLALLVAAVLVSM